MALTREILIKGGTLIGGTSAPATRAEVAIAGGKIVAEGKVSRPAKRTIDAEGLAVAPGFICPHTHYDGQICWDGATTSSSWHGGPRW